MGIVQNAVRRKGRKRRYGGTGASGCAPRRMMPQSRYGIRLLKDECSWVHIPGTQSVVATTL
jgi:hypothetical protein